MDGSGSQRREETDQRSEESYSRQRAAATDGGEIQHGAAIGGEIHPGASTASGPPTGGQLGPARGRERSSDRSERDGQQEEVGRVRQSGEPGQPGEAG
jgi:hypothetical protein